MQQGLANRLDQWIGGKKWRLVAVAAGVAIGLVLLAGVLFAGTANAEGIGGKRSAPLAAEAPAPAADKWSGGWIAAGLGYAAEISDIEDAKNSDIEVIEVVSSGDIALATHDVMGCGAAGVDRRLGSSNIVLGLGADICFTTAKTAISSWDRQWSVYARGGVLLTPNVLGYGLVGYTDLDGVAQVPDLTDSEGLTLGLGLEALLKDGLFVRAEGRRIDLGGDSPHVDTAQYQAMVLVGFRFGGAR